MSFKRLKSLHECHPSFLVTICSGQRAVGAEHNSHHHHSVGGGWDAKGRMPCIRTERTPETILLPLPGAGSHSSASVGSWRGLCAPRAGARANSNEASLTPRRAGTFAINLDGELSPKPLRDNKHSVCAPSSAEVQLQGPHIYPPPVDLSASP